MPKPRRPQGVGIAGAMDYTPAGPAPAQEAGCFVCGGPFRGGCSAGARILPPLVQVCSKECAADPRYADPSAKPRRARR